jgi:hypothetical protein
VFRFILKIVAGLVAVILVFVSDAAHADMANGNYLFDFSGDLERKLDRYKIYYNRHRCHTGLAGITPAQRGGAPAYPIANLDSYRWRKHCNGLFQTPAAA